MSIALFAIPGILAPLHGFFRWFAPGTAPVVRPCQPQAQGGRPNELAIHPIAACAHQVKTTAPRHSTRIATRRPLRIVRIMEAGQPPAHVGRMVISGRMADVCAELDRLAAREAAQH